MDKDHTGQFVLGSDDSLSGRDHYLEQTQRKLIDKLSLRMTLISILIPCVIGIVLAYLTLDMRGRLARIEDAGSVEMSKFQEELNTRLDYLNTENEAHRKKLEEGLHEKMASLWGSVEKNAASLQSRFSKTEKDMEALARLKADNEKLAAEIRKLSGENLAMKKELSGLTGQNVKLSSMVADLQKRSLDISGNKALTDSLKQEISRLKADSIDKGDLATELKKQKVFYQLEIQEMTAKFDRKLQALKPDNPGAVSK
jgi:chromosome segregation ATPase